MHLRSFLLVILSIHIPKTAGTSFQNALQEAYGDRVLMDYGNDKPLSWLANHKKRRWATRWRAWRERRRLARDYDVIHGHYAPNKYFHLRDKKLAAFFRDPVEQSLSLYEFVRRDQNPDTESYSAVCLQNVGFVEFLSLPNYRFIYRKYLSGRSPATLDFVGLTEDYEESLELFRRIFGVELKYHEDRKNTEQSYAETLQRAGGRELMEDYLAESMSYFRAARVRYNDLRRKYFPAVRSRSKR